jgi:hypothetical protein
MGTGLILSLVLKTRSHQAPLRRSLSGQKAVAVGFPQPGVVIGSDPDSEGIWHMIMFICTREWRYVLVTLLV